ncbi:regulator of microtubule dynamics protein 3 [Spea bombifrons]|uniref:regulator of microtubule dynamics protein 3 n=1 Tax=Spea bombifrons TaxID=233779 RepID=UPI00234952E5|nr:regulator of microtubule dynamics protein 3 [Spea bombifrons]
MSKQIFFYRLGFGLIFGATAGAVIFLVYKRHRNNKKLTLKQNGYCLSTDDSKSLTSKLPKAVLETAVSQGEQLELLNRLDYVISSISELRSEVQTLRDSIHGLVEDIVGEVRLQLEENQKAVRRRRYLPYRERTDSTGSSSIYFTTSSGAGHTDVESEGGYTTANAESDYDRESSKGSEEEEDEVSCETVRTMRRDSVDLVMDEETTMVTDLVDEELMHLLQKSDQLSSGDSEDKSQGFQMLLSNKLLYGEHQDFLWRLARSYSDMCDTSEDVQEKKTYAFDGKEEAENALRKGDQSAECHKWFAILCGQLAEHEVIQKRIQLGNLFKEHIEKAISLKPDDTRCYYLLGRWCYQVSNLGWLERKTASALYENPPNATVHEALQNFLKSEELMPGYSKALRIYIAKCYKDLGNLAMAAHWLKLAAELPSITKEDHEMASTMDEIATYNNRDNLLGL